MGECRSGDSVTLVERLCRASWPAEPCGWDLALDAASGVCCQPTLCSSSPSLDLPCLRRESLLREPSASCSVLLRAVGGCSHEGPDVLSEKYCHPWSGQG